MHVRRESKRETPYYCSYIREILIDFKNSVTGTFPRGNLQKKRCLESHHTVSVSHCRYTTLRNKNIQNPYRMQSRQRQSSLRAHTLKWRGCSRGRWAAGVLSREDQQGRKTSQHKNGICRRVKIRLHWLEIRQSRSHNEYVNASCFCHNSVDTRLRCAGILIIALLQIS